MVNQVYDWEKAVHYAEKWWNDYNPAYPRFLVDCTNYISQCLLAGGLTMNGYPVREQGWWYRNNNWSFSWSVAHSLRWYLGNLAVQQNVLEVKTALELYPGDIICYDFEGNNRWNHTAIVVAKDQENLPLVNAHTDNSRHRYWAYEDSAAWSSQTQYKFFRIGNGEN